MVQFVSLLSVFVCFAPYSVTKGHWTLHWTRFATSPRLSQKDLQLKALEARDAGVLTGRGLGALPGGLSNYMEWAQWPEHKPTAVAWDEFRGTVGLFGAGRYLLSKMGKTEME